MAEQFVFEHLVAINENENEVVNEINDGNFFNKAYDYPLPYLALTSGTAIVFDGFDTGLCKSGIFKRVLDNIWDENNIKHTIVYTWFTKIATDQSFMFLPIVQEEA